MKTDNLSCVPKVRFPGFDEPWRAVRLGDIAELVTEKVGAGKCIPMSVSSGRGLIPQTVKFGRVVAGGQLKNYTVIHKYDFAYNKSATSLYPEGYIAMLDDYESGAVPNSIFTCFRIKAGVNPFYLNHLFSSNYHGKWLGRFIEVGARAHGSLSINDEHLLNLPLPIPSLDEQQRIASCLSSLDDVIKETERKIESLKKHKKGLMQRLFPTEGSSTPTMRFEKYEYASKWDSVFLGDAFDIRNGYTPSKSNADFWNNGTIPWFRMEDIRNHGRHLTDSIQHITYRAVKGKLFPANSIILATTATIGEHALITVDFLSNQQFTCLSINDDFQNLIDINYFYQYMFIIDEWCVKNANHGGMDSVDIKVLKQLRLPLPAIQEQQKIASCLSSIDDIITSYEEKVKLLRLHKKGLMQQLFPPMNINL